MNPQQAERYLLSLELFGMRFGLDRMRRLMTALGHERFVVAGTDIGSGVATRIALNHRGQTGDEFTSVARGRALSAMQPIG